MFDEMGVPTIDDRWSESCRTWFARSVRNAGVLILVAECGGGLLGSGMAELAHGAPGPACPSGRTAHLSNLVIEPAFRRRGHGSQIMSALLDWASEVADRAELHASGDGISMYRRFGFKETANRSMRLSML